MPGLIGSPGFVLLQCGIMHLIVKKDMIIITTIINILSALAEGGYEWIRN